VESIFNFPYTVLHKKQLKYFVVLSHIFRSKHLSIKYLEHAPPWLNPQDMSDATTVLKRWTSSKVLFKKTI